MYHFVLDGSSPYKGALAETDHSIPSNTKVENAAQCWFYLPWLWAKKCMCTYAYAYIQKPESLDFSERSQSKPEAFQEFKTCMMQKCVKWHFIFFPRGRKTILSTQYCIYYWFVLLPSQVHIVVLKRN